MKGIVGVILLCAAVQGCAEYQTISKAVAVQGAQAADATLASAEWGLCDAVTVGAWMRRYGTSSDLAGAWHTLCARPFNQGITPATATLNSLPPGTVLSIPSPVAPGGSGATMKGPDMSVPGVLSPSAPGSF